MLGREPVKFLSLSLVCGGALCVFIPGMAKGTQLGDGCSLGKYEGEEKYDGLSQKPTRSGNQLFPIEKIPLLGGQDLSALWWDPC